MKHQLLLGGIYDRSFDVRAADKLELKGLMVIFVRDHIEASGGDGWAGDFEGVFKAWAKSKYQRIVGEGMNSLGKMLGSLCKKATPPLPAPHHVRANTRGRNYDGYLNIRYKNAADLESIIGRPVPAEV